MIFLLCIAGGWKNEGVAFTSSGSRNVYRLFNGSAHLFTASEEERDYLEMAGWTFEGVGFKVA